MIPRFLPLALLLSGTTLLAAGTTNPPALKSADFAAEEVLLTFAPASLADGETSMDLETDFTFTNPGGPKQLTVQLDEDMPPGARLEVQVLRGAMSTGRRVLTRRATSLAFHLEAAQAAPLRLRYRFIYDVTAAPGAYARTISFTLTDQ